jgi:DNA-binding MarR family transcriptional regulator
MQTAHADWDKLIDGYSAATQKGPRMAAPKKRAATGSATVSQDFLRRLEKATRGLLALNVSVLEHMEKRIGLAPLRALQSLDRVGPCLVTELGDDLGLLSSTASRLSDRLADAGYITRRVSPANRRATLLELTDAGRAVLDELAAIRLHDFGEVAEQMSATDRAALVQGAQAFTDAHYELSKPARQEQARPRAAGEH